MRIDTTLARNARGVVAVFVAEDIGGTNLHGLIKRDHPVFCVDRVRYSGDALGVVVATSADAARAAAKLVNVEYEKLPVIGTMAEALAEGSFPIHESGNVLATQLVRKGDADKALAEADVIVKSHISHAMRGSRILGYRSRNGAYGW